MVATLILTGQDYFPKEIQIAEQGRGCCAGDELLKLSMDKKAFSTNSAFGICLILDPTLGHLHFQLTLLVANF
jgi:hypothetical protein